MYLIDAAAGVDPLPLAIERAKRDVEHDSPTLTCDDRPAQMVFAGFRKIISIFHEREDDTLGPGDELTYSMFNVDTKADFDKLVSGQSVMVEYKD